MVSTFVDLCWGDFEPRAIVKIFDSDFHLLNKGWAKLGMSCEHEHHNHNHNGDSHVLPIPTNESQSLLSKIDLHHVTALNLSNPPDDIVKVFRSARDKYKLKPVIKSDCDSQLIINIPFLNSSIKLFSVILRTNGDKFCAKTIKLFRNDKTIDFDNIDTKKPTFVLNHPHVGVMYDDEEDEMPESLDNESEFVEHFLPRHKFTGVQHLTIFIEDIYNNDVEDECHLHYIELRGEFTELTRDPVISIYESAANPADHKNIVEESVNFSIGK